MYEDEEDDDDIYVPEYLDDDDDYDDMYVSSFLTMTMTMMTVCLKFFDNDGMTEEYLRARKTSAFSMAQIRREES